MLKWKWRIKIIVDGKWSSHILLHGNVEEMEKGSFRIAQEVRSSYYGVTFHWIMSRCCG